MGQILTDLGEEWMVKTNLDTESVDVGLYNDSTDAVADTDDISDLTTEPSDGNYSRQTGEALSALDSSGDWGVDTDTTVVFDVTSTTGTVDSYFVVANFTAVDTGDGGATDHMVFTGSLSQSYDLSNLDQLTISAGGVKLTVS